jgi:hypothetical protein
VAAERRSKKKTVKRDPVDVEAHRIVKEVARERREKVSRRKWSVETAMMSGDEMGIEDRIRLAKKVEDYVWSECE